MPKSDSRGGEDWSFAELAQLWTSNGGDGSVAEVAAAIALAESGGWDHNVGNNTNGTRDVGLWQINSSHGYSQADMFDPNKNAQAAIALSKTPTGYNFRPWCSMY